MMHETATKHVVVSLVSCGNVTGELSLSQADRQVDKNSSNRTTAIAMLYLQVG